MQGYLHPSAERGGRIWRTQAGSRCRVVDPAIQGNGRPQRVQGKIFGAPCISFLHFRMKDAGFNFDRMAIGFQSLPSPRKT